MAYTERDDLSDYTYENTRPRSSDIVSQLAGSEKPILLGRHNRTSKSVFSKYAKDDDGDSNTNARPSTGGWMSGNGKGTRLGLAEAFQRTDVNGNFTPRERPSAREGRVGAISDSRIPRTRPFSPLANSSPPRDHDDEYGTGGRHERALSVPLDSESDTGTRQGSPSPAPRQRRPRSRDESGSESSRKNSLDDRNTDEYFEKARLQEEKDKARMKKIMASTTPAFTKGRIGPKVEIATKTLARKTSASSLEAEPPIRPPRSWGSKSKKNDHWMRKILSPDTSLEPKDTPEDQAFLERQRAGPDVPMTSVENLSSIQNITPPASRPASVQRINGSPEKSQMWNADLDFTAQSIQMSTSPQIRMISTKLDEIRRNEIQSLTARAVATNRLEEIRERNSEDRSSTNFEAVPPESQDRGRNDKKFPERQEQDPYYEMTILEEEGDHIPDTPITIYTRAAYERLQRSRSDSGSRERTLSTTREGSTGRSSHKRDDSRDLLRRLSRVASRSPEAASPARTEVVKITKTAPQDRPPEKRDEKPKKVEVPPKMEEKPAEKRAKETSTKIEATVTISEKSAEKRPESTHKRRIGLDLDAKRYSSSSTPPKSDVDPEERITAEARLFELQDNKSERNSLRGQSRSPSPASEDGQFDETPKPRVDPLSLPTPRVTGAFIETPAPARRQLRRTSSSRDIVSEPKVSVPDVPQSEKQATISRPPLINIAKLTTAAEDIRQIQREIELEGLEDATLDQFDAILAAEAAAETTTIEPILDLEYDERGKPLSETALQRRIEQIQLDRMSQSIKKTSSSIRDARQGIERLEEQVSSVPTRQISTKPTTSDDILYVNIKIPVPRLWISRPPPKPGMKPSWKFTWIGLLLTVFFAWYLTETAMCAQFCHPVDAYTDKWSPSDPFFPWAIPTKLDQWTGEIVSTALGMNTPLYKYRLPRGYRPLHGEGWRPAGVRRELARESEGSIFEDEII